MREWKTGLAHRYVAPTLSQYITGVAGIRIPSSWRRTQAETSFPFSKQSGQKLELGEISSSPVVNWPTHSTLPVLSSQPPSSAPHQNPPSPLLNSSPSSPTPQVSPPISNSNSVSLSSEPTAPTENGPQPTAQQPSPSFSSSSAHSNQLNSPQISQPNSAQTQTNSHNSAHIQSPTPTSSSTSSSPSSSPNLQPPSPSPEPPLQIVPANRHNMSTRAKSGITKPNTKYLLAIFNSPHYEPRTVTQALQDERWRNACTSEINAQIEQIHMSSDDVFATERYSASVEDLATLFCFLDDHETGW